MDNHKPLGGKSYGSIGHLPNSRIGNGDHFVHEGQYNICCVKKRDKHDLIIVQEKLDGSNVGVANINGEVVPLTRAGYVANTSPYPMHHKFYDWVVSNKERFNFLEVGQRLCGEWLIQDHGTLYNLPHEPFVVFDIISDGKRMIHKDFISRVSNRFVTPRLIHCGDSISCEDVLSVLEPSGHGALEPVEGFIYRVERHGKVDFLAKYVRKDKVDGKYLAEEKLNNWLGKSEEQS